MTTNFTYTEGSANKRGKGMIENGTLVYVKVKDGDFKYQSKDKEFSAEIVVDKKTAKAFKKAFPNNKAKEIDTEDFEAKYKIAPPFPDADEQFVIKLSKSSQLGKDIEVNGRTLKKGKPVPYNWASRPKVFMPEGEGVVDITLDEDKLPANGSKGTIAFITTTNDFGTFPQLDGVLVTDLIPYEGSAGSAFGKVVGGPNVPDAFDEDDDEPENEEKEEAQTPDNADDFDSVDEEEEEAEEEESEEEEEEEKGHPFG